MEIRHRRVLAGIVDSVALNGLQLNEQAVTSVSLNPVADDSRFINQETDYRLCIEMHAKISIV
jgi:hypothetical protein